MLLINNLPAPSNARNERCATRDLQPIGPPHGMIKLMNGMFVAPAEPHTSRRRGDARLNSQHSARTILCQSLRHSRFRDIIAFHRVASFMTFRVESVLPSPPRPSHVNTSTYARHGVAKSAGWRERTGYLMDCWYRGV